MNELYTEKTPKLSLWSLMKSINVFSQDTVSIRTIRSILSELIPLSVYFPDIAESDILTKEMITNAYNHKGACFGCSKNCKDSAYYPYCFLLEASIKYDNLRFKRDTQNLNQLVGDVFFDPKGNSQVFYCSAYIYDYIYYLFTNNDRNGRGHGKRADHFKARFKFATTSNTSSSDPKKYFTAEFLDHMEHFRKQHLLNHNNLSRMISESFPDEYKSISELFPSVIRTSEYILPSFVFMCLS